MKLFNFLIFLFFTISVLGQRHPSVSYTEQNVLPNNAVRCLLKSDDGALWIGTDNGLVRKYNNQFTTYYKEDGLAQNNIWAVAQSKDRTLWIGSYGKGLSTYRKGVIKEYEYNDQLVHLEVTQLMIHESYLYVGTSDGVAIINIKNGKLVKNLKPKIPFKDSFRIQDFFLIENEVYAVSYLQGVFKVQEYGATFNLFQITDAKELYAAQVYRGQLFLSGKEFYKKINLDSVVKPGVYNKALKIESSILWDYAVADNLFYAAAWGIYQNDGGIYKWENGSFKNKNKDYGVESTQVTSLQYDQDVDRLFIGTLDHGLYEVYLNETIRFESVPHESVIDLAHLEEINAYLFNDGLEIGETSINESRFKEWQSEFVKNHPEQLPKHKDFFYELDYDTPAANIVFYSLKTNNNEFWINTSIGLYVFNKKAELVRYMPLHTLEFNFTDSGDLIETNFYHGSRVYDKLEPLSYTYFDNVADVNNPGHVVGSAQQKDKTYFTSIFSGLYAYKNGVFTSYVKNELWQEKRLRHITRLDKDRLAISNEDGDVFIVEDTIPIRVKKISRNYKHGNTINFLSSYKGRLIIGTSKGVVLYKDGVEIFIDKEQGLDDKVTSCMVKNDTLFLGSGHGLFKVALLDVLNKPNRVKSLKIIDFKVNGVVQQPLRMKQSSLDYNQNSIQLTLATNQHPFPEKLQYSYRINEDEDWISIKGAVINLPYLQPAFYDIQVKIEDASTGAIFQKSVINFIVNDPFYQSTWFIILCFSIVIGILYTYFSLKRKGAKQLSEEREAITKRVEEVKLEALLSQMNPHFVFNSLNSVQYFISNNENDRAMKYLGTFAGLMRANLNNSTRQFIALEEEIAYLKSYTQLENARFDDRISILFNIDKELSLSQVSIPNMVLQPFVENVFVHAFPSRIESPILEIEFSKIDEDHYRCVVKDNGIGNASFTKNKHHVSKGMQLVQERLSFLGYDPEKALRILHTSKGTTITLDLEL